MTEEEFWGRPVDPRPTEADRARIVREALDKLASDDTVDTDDRRLLATLAYVARDATLARLGRLLK